MGALVVVCAIAWMKYQESLAPADLSAAETSTETQKWGDFDLLTDCELVSHRHNDGDSFHVATGKGEFEFRLYYVDAPESAAKTYRNGENNFKRLAQQGRAMGGLSQKQITGIGKEAKHFVKDLLGQQKFRVATRWENVYGPERRYAFVLVLWNGQERYLHEILVEKGMARIHTKPAKLPDGASVSSHLRQLRKLEKMAKQQHQGAWGIK